MNQPAEDDAPPAQPPSGTGQLSRRLAVLVAVAFFMEFLDGTIVATAAPDMARSLAVAPAEIGISITAYLLTAAALIPVSGWLADRWGTRTVFALAVTLFTVASALCATSTSLPELVIWRLVQGGGGAMMVPVGRLVVMRGIAKHEVIRAIAFLTWPGLAAPVVAPLLGGLFAQYLSWHWIFLVNVPIGVVLLVLTRWVPQTHGSVRRPLDWLGFALLAGCLTGLVLATSELSSPAANPVEVSAGLIAGAGLGLAAARHLLAADHPLLDPAVLRIPTFRLPHASGSVYRATVFAVPFVLPLMLQAGFGASAVYAGALVMFVFAGNLAIKPATTAILRRFSFRAVIAAAALTVAATMALCAALTPASPWPVAGALLLVSGAARSVGFTAYATLAFADVQPALMSTASTVSATMQQLAGGLGVALGALLIELFTPGEAGAAEAGATPYRLTFLALAVITAALVVPAARLPRDAGHQLHGS